MRSWHLVSCMTLIKLNFLRFNFFICKTGTIIITRVLSFNKCLLLPAICRADTVLGSEGTQWWQEALESLYLKLLYFRVGEGQNIIAFNIKLKLLIVKINSRKLNKILWDHIKRAGWHRWGVIKIFKRTIIWMFLQGYLNMNCERGIGGEGWKD